MKKVFAKIALMGMASLILSACSSNQVDTSATETQPVVQEPVVTEQLPPQKTAEELAREADIEKRKERVIYFDFDKSEIKSEYRELLQAHGEFLAKHPEINVVLEGHADERGTPEYNIALGERRAKAVADIFRTLGVSDSQMQVVSYGEERPVDPGHNEAAWAKNRRVEIRYND